MKRTTGEIDVVALFLLGVSIALLVMGDMLAASVVTLALVIQRRPR
jgi:hypothetical protein